jgi:hypothetical protein
MRRRAAPLAVVALAAWALSSGPGRAVTLISASEAQLPEPPPLEDSVRGVNAGPSLIQMLPPRGGATRSPFRLWFRFAMPCDPATITLSLPKQPSVDLTSRIKPYVTAQGVDIPDAEAPPGNYKLRFVIRDASGTQRAGIVIFSVSP